MKQLISTKLELPIIYLVSDEKEFMELPFGIPFIYGNEEHYDLIVQYLEWNILLRSAEATGLPLNWEAELFKIGYSDVSIGGDIDLYFSGDRDSETLPEFPKKGEFSLRMDDYLKDGFLVSYDILSSLHVIPSWLRDLEESVKVNILNAVTFNPTSFNKKLGGFYGAAEMTSSKRNLGILDFSGSIPVTVIVTTAALAKTLSRTFFCDIMITGSTTKIFKYEELEYIDLMKEAELIGRDNDQIEFIKLVSEHKEYNTVFSFGDNDAPGYPWRNTHNDKARRISVEEGKLINQWNVEKVISLHTKQNGEETGYTQWFTPKEGVTHITNWLHTLKK